MDKELKIVPPEGYEIDKEHSTFDCIKFKLIKKFVDNDKALITGFYINGGKIYRAENRPNALQSYNIFATEKQAKSALAMARISQIMANDERFGGAITDEEWTDDNMKYTIAKCRDYVYSDWAYNCYTFLAFHTPEQRNLFLEENEQLVMDYLMI